MSRPTPSGATACPSDTAARRRPPENVVGGPPDHVAHPTTTPTDVGAESEPDDAATHDGLYPGGLVEPIRRVGAAPNPQAMIRRRRSLGVSKLRGLRARVVVPFVALGLASAIAVPTVLASDGQRLRAPKTVLLDEAQDDIGELRPETAPTTVATKPPSEAADSATATPALASGDVEVGAASTTTSTSLPGPPAGIGGWSAWATGTSVDVFAAPGDLAPVANFANPWRYDAPLVLLVTDRPGDGWLEVVLPQRPNGSTGWIRESQVTLVANEWRISVSLAEHRMVVVHGLEVVHDVSVAVGMPSTPTPPGTYYVNAVVLTGRPQGAYGPAALALNGFSDVLTEFGGGDGQLAIHGTNKPGSIGRSASHGCVRVANDVVALLAEHVPLGTPVEITP